MASIDDRLSDRRRGFFTGEDTGNLEKTSLSHGAVTMP